LAVFELATQSRLNVHLATLLPCLRAPYG
jgi:hypothetical protein